MAKFHINWRGEAGPCSAVSGDCLFGGEDDHFPTPAAVGEAYEAVQVSAFSGGLKKPEPEAEAVEGESVLPKGAGGRFHRGKKLAGGDLGRLAPWPPADDCASQSPLSQLA